MSKYVMSEITNDHDRASHEPLDLAQPACPRGLPDLGQLELKKVGETAAE